MYTILYTYSCVEISAEQALVYRDKLKWLSVVVGYNTRDGLKQSLLLSVFLEHDLL